MAENREHFADIKPRDLVVFMQSGIFPGGEQPDPITFRREFVVQSEEQPAAAKLRERFASTDAYTFRIEGGEEDHEYGGFGIREGHYPVVIFHHQPQTSNVASIISTFRPLETHP